MATKNIIVCDRCQTEQALSSGNKPYRFVRLQSGNQREIEMDLCPECHEVVWERCVALLKGGE